jgi:hypothetical protein
MEGETPRVLRDEFGGELPQPEELPPDIILRRDAVWWTYKGVNYGVKIHSADDETMRELMLLAAASYARQTGAKSRWLMGHPVPKWEDWVAAGNVS